MEVPKGKLIPIGGNEDKGITDQPLTEDFLELGILRRFMNEVKGVDSRIEVITTASSIPRITGNNYLKAFEKLGAKNVNILHIRKREHAFKPDFLTRLKQCDAILFSGGDQLSITKCLGGTDFFDIMYQRYMYENFVIAGTSAGAMAMSGTMIYEGDAIRALYKDEIKLTPGLGLIREAIIDTHFMHRGRFGRLAQAVSHNPGSIGIGFGEDTGAVIRDGNMIEIIGSGLVIIVDGHDIRYTNVMDINNGSPLSIENLKVHVLARGNCYSLKTRKFFAAIPSAEMVEKKQSAKQA